MSEPPVPPVHNEELITEGVDEWPDIQGYRWWSKREQLRRLAAEIQRFELRMDSLRKSGGPTDARGQRALQEAKGLIRKARWWVDHRAVDAGWPLLLEAYRQELYWMTPVERAAAAKSLRAEAEGKLRGWRKNAFRSLIPPDDEPGNVDADVLREAMFVLSEDGQNLYRKLGLMSQQIRGLSIVIGLILIGFLAVTGLTEADGQSLSLTPTLLSKILMLGALGGAISAVQPLKLASGRMSVPNVLRQAPMTFVRPLVGAGAALAVYWFVQAGLIQIGGGGQAGLLAISFASGFSERLVMRAVEAMVGGIEKGTIPDESIPPEGEPESMERAAPAVGPPEGKPVVEELGETLLAAIPFSPEGEPADSLGKELLARIPDRPE